MQKKLIAVAIAAISAAPAFAQSNVTIYGRADIGMVSRSGTSGGANTATSKTEMASGLNGASRLGFKGSEDLGNGMKAIFQMEYGTGVDQVAGTTNLGGGLTQSRAVTRDAAGVITADVTTVTQNSAAAPASTAATWSQRNAYLGLTGNFGTVVAGRLDGVRYGIWTALDPFAGNGIGNANQVGAGQVDRADNAIAYISPSFSGFTVTAAYSSNIGGAEGSALSYLGGAPRTGVGSTLPIATINNLTGVTTLTGTVTTATTLNGGQVGNQNDAVLNTLMLKYENGPITAFADYETVKSKKETADFNAAHVATFGALASGRVKIKVMTFGGSYDFGAVKVSGLYDTHEADVGAISDLLKSRSFMLGAVVPMGKFTGKVSYAKQNDRTAADADFNKFAIGANYALSKRTVAYFDYARISNNGNSAARLMTGGNGYNHLSGGGATTAAADVGVKGFQMGVGHNF